MACAAAIVACSKEEPIAINQGQAISFSNPFINKVTRAIDYSHTAMPGEFKIYGTTTGSETGSTPVAIYSGETATKDGSVYSPSTTQYWVDGTKYAFQAVVDGEIVGGEIAYVSNRTDILFANVSEFTYVKNSSPVTCPLTFNHILSKVQFTFKNDITDNALYTYKVTGVTINGIYTAGDFNVADGTWTPSGTANGTANFGNISNATDTADSTEAVVVGNNSSATSHESLLFIPAAYTDLTISCTITTYYNGTAIDEESFSVTGFDYTFVKGNAYNFVISKELDSPIKFSATLAPWTPDATGTGVTVQ